MVTFDYFQRFKGDISAHEELSTNTKGGSISTVVKKSLAGFIEDAAAIRNPKCKLSAAGVKINDQNSFLIMTSADSRETYHIRRTGKHSVEVYIESDEEKEIDV